MTYKNKTAAFIENYKEDIMERWTNYVRNELENVADCPVPVLRDHFLDVLQSIQEALERCETEDQNFRTVTDFQNFNPPTDAGDIHGKQRASVTGYTAAHVYWEYIWLRRIIVHSLNEHGIANHHAMEVISCVIEVSARHALLSFNEAIENIQRKLIGALVHDLRSPLVVIDGTAELLASGLETRDNKVVGEGLQRAVRRMNNMLTEMLQTISIEGGQGFDMVFEKDVFYDNMAILARDTLAIYGDRFKFTMPEDEPDIAIDQAAVTRTVENLISNAFKHGTGDQVTMNIENLENEVRICVHNHGNPIPKEDQERIFEFLRRSKGHRQSASSENKSWGMGLALAKATAIGHKGSVDVESSAKDGTTFTLVLPKGARSPGEKTTVII